MQIVSSGDNLHKMSNPVLWKKKENILKCRLLNKSREYLMYLDRRFCADTVNLDQTPQNPTVFRHIDR